MSNLVDGRQARAEILAEKSRATGQISGGVVVAVVAFTAALVVAVFVATALPIAPASTADANVVVATYGP
jgi:hypothetical protein